MYSLLNNNKYKYISWKEFIETSFKIVNNKKEESHCHNNRYIQYIVYTV